MKKRRVSSQACESFSLPYPRAVAWFPFRSHFSSLAKRGLKRVPYKIVGERKEGGEKGEKKD